MFYKLFESVERRTGFKFHPQAIENFASLNNSGRPAAWPSKVLLNYRINGGAQLFEMTAHLQRLFFEQGMNPHKEAAYKVVNECFPLSGQTLSGTLRDERLEAQLCEESRLMRKYGILECPSLFLQVGDRIMPVCTGYQETQCLIKTINHQLQGRIVNNN